MNKKEAILKVYNCIKKETAKKAISIELKKQKTQLIDSKVGGTPYLPVGAEIPVDDEGKQLISTNKLRRACRNERLSSKRIITIFHTYG